MNSNEYTQYIPYDLIIQVGTGEISEGDRGILNSWIEHNPKNREVFNEILEIHSLTGSLDIYQKLDSEKSWKNLEIKMDENLSGKKIRKAQSIIKNLNPWVLTLAASLVLFIFFSLAFFHFEELKTNTQGSLTKTFEDGTRITLKGNSAIRFRRPFWGSPRSIEMKYGDILYSVHHDNQKPFLVILGNEKVEDLGTQFQIKKDKNSEKIEVFSGKIAFYAPNFISPEVLLAGENLVFNSDLGKVESFIKRDSMPGEESKSFRFLNSRLGEVALEIEKAYHVQIQFERPEIQVRKLTGSYTNSSPDSLLNQIGLTLNLKISKTQTGFLLSK